LAVILRENRLFYFSLFLIIFFALLPTVKAQKTVAAGKLSLAQNQLKPGQTISLAGEWRVEKSGSSALLILLANSG